MTSTTVFIIFIPILAILLLAINLLLAPHNPYQEKDSVFECGFHSFLGQNRTQFSVSFFIFGLLFLLLDTELLLAYPLSVSSYTNDIYGLSTMMVFFALLTCGFVFELGKNALTIDSRQTHTYSNVDTAKPLAFLEKMHNFVFSGYAFREKMHKLLFSGYAFIEKMHKLLFSGYANLSKKVIQFSACVKANLRLIWTVSIFVLTMFIIGLVFLVFKCNSIRDILNTLSSVSTREFVGFVQFVGFVGFVYIVFLTAFLGWFILEAQKSYPLQYCLSECAGFYLGHFEFMLENLVLSNLLPDNYSGFLCILGLAMVLLNVLNKDSTSLRDKLLLLKNTKVSELLANLMMIFLLIFAVKSLLILTGFSVDLNTHILGRFLYALFCNLVLLKLVLIGIIIATGRELNLSYFSINLFTILLFFLAGSFSFYYIIPITKLILATELTDAGLILKARGVLYTPNNRPIIPEHLWEGMWKIVTKFPIFGKYLHSIEKTLHTTTRLDTAKSPIISECRSSESLASFTKLNRTSVPVFVSTFDKYNIPRFKHITPNLPIRISQPVTHAVTGLFNPKLNFSQLIGYYTFKGDFIKLNLYLKENLIPIRETISDLASKTVSEYTNTSVNIKIFCDDAFVEVKASYKNALLDGVEWFKNPMVGLFKNHMGDLCGPYAKGGFNPGDSLLGKTPGYHPEFDLLDKTPGFVHDFSQMPPAQNDLIVMSGRYSDNSAAADISTTSAPIPSFDFSAIDSKLDLFKRNLSTFSDERIQKIEKEINSSMEELGNLSTKSHQEVTPKITELMEYLKKLGSRQEFNDLHPVMIEFVHRVHNTDNKNPDNTLLAVDNVQYWKKKITYAHKLQANSISHYSLIKNYVKENKILSEYEKTEVFTMLRQLNRLHNNVARLDVDIFKQCRDKSEILNELKKIRENNA